MSTTAVTVVTFGCIFGGACLGMALNRTLPVDHLSQESKDVVKLGAGLIATLAALVLSLLISSAKNTFDQVNDELLQSAAKAILLDRILAAYGPDAREVRDMLKHIFATNIELLTSGDPAQIGQLDTVEAATRGERVQARLRDLAPGDEPRRGLQMRALELTGELSTTRWLLLLQTQGSVPMPLVVALVLWLAIIFATFGLFAPRNATVVTTLFVCALSAAGAIFLILEMDRPFDGWVRISGAALRDALAHIGQ